MEQRRVDNVGIDQLFNKKKKNVVKASVVYRLFNISLPQREYGRNEIKVGKVVLFRRLRH